MKLRCDHIRLVWFDFNVRVHLIVSFGFGCYYISNFLFQFCTAFLLKLQGCSEVDVACTL